MGDAQELANSIVHLYLSLVRYQRSRNQEIKKETGLSGRRLAILRCLIQQSPRSVGEIGRYLYVSDATVSRILDDMEVRGHARGAAATRTAAACSSSPPRSGRRGRRRPSGVVAPCATCCRASRWRNSNGWNGSRLGTRAG